MELPPVPKKSRMKRRISREAVVSCSRQASTNLSRRSASIRTTSLALSSLSAFFFLAMICIYVMQTEYDDCLYLVDIIRQSLSEATKQFFNHPMSYRENPPVGRVRCALPPSLETAETWRAHRNPTWRPIFIAGGALFLRSMTSYRKNPPVGRVRCALPPSLETAETWRAHRNPTERPIFIAGGALFLRSMTS